MTDRELSHCERLFMVLPTPVYAIDPAGKVTVWNPAMEACTGIGASEVVGKKAWVGFSAKKRLTPADRALNSSEEETEDEFVVTHRATGVNQTYRVVARPMLDGDEARGAMAAFLDRAGGGAGASDLIRTVAEKLDAMAKGEVPEPVTVPWEGESEQARLRLNECIGSMCVLAEINAGLQRMAQNDHTKDVESVGPGVFGSLAEATNLVQKRVRVITEVSRAIAAGDLGGLDMLKQIGDGAGRRSPNDELVPSYIRMMETLNSLVSEVRRMAEEHNKGDIDAVIPADRFEGVFQSLALGLNEMVAGHIAVKKKAMACVAEFAKGNFEASLEQFPGKKAFINDNIERLRACVKGFIREMRRMSEEHNRGDIDVVIPVDQFEGAFRDMSEGVNEMVAGHIALKRKAMACVGEFARGNFEATLERFPGKKSFINDTIERLRSNINTFIEEMRRMSEEHNKGDIDVVIPVDKLEGSFRIMAEGVNSMVAGHIAVKKKAMTCIAEFGQGNFAAPLERFPGKKAFINDTIEQVRGHLKALIRDTSELVQASIEGRLKTRADASQHHGDFRRIVEGVNTTLDAVIQPVIEAAEVLEKLAQRDLTVRVMGNYQGDHAKIKEAINASVSALQESLTQVSEAVGQVAVASGQIASSSQSVAQGASEQASALEQVSSSLEEMSGMTKQNAASTEHAKALAKQTKLAADKGSEAMTKMVEAMGKIRVASEGTAEIIRDINEISFQTNLLALNAAVEAARAGDAGRGFAVVAEEVRNLALRSKDAAKKTEDLIKQSVQLSDNGQVISKEVNGNLRDIVDSVDKVTGIIGEIAAASQEQARGINHVSGAMSQMDKVTQQNAANSEESSSAAEELSSQSEQLAAMIGSFRLGSLAH